MRVNVLNLVGGFMALFVLCGIATAVVMPHENLAARALVLKDYAIRPLAVRQDVAAELLVKRGDSYIPNQRRAHAADAGVAAAAAAVEKRDVAASVLPTSPPPAAAATETVSTSPSSSSMAEAASGTITNRIPYPQWSSTAGGPSLSSVSTGPSTEVKTSGATSILRAAVGREWLGALAAGGLAVPLHLALGA